MAISFHLNTRTAIFLLLIIALSIAIRSEYIREDGDRLLRYDPYYHYRMASTILEEGHRPETDYLASWPTGEPSAQYPPLYHYFLAYTYKIFGGLTNNNLLLWSSYSCCIPVILISILAFLVGRQLTDTKGGLFSALLFALIAFPVRRTLIGFADTDGFILFFSLLASFFWINSFYHSTSRKLHYAALAGITLFLFELTWVGYWYLLFLLLGASLVTIGINYVQKKEMDLIPLAVLLLAFLVPHTLFALQIIQAAVLILSGIALYLTYRARKWYQIAAFVIFICCLVILYAEGILAMPFAWMQFTESATQKGSIFYPYLGPFIAQRQQITLTYLLESFTITLLLAPLGFIILLRNNSARKYILASFFGLYTAGGIATMSLGVRFLLILSIPLLLLSSITLSAAWETLVRNSPGRKFLAVCGFLLLFVPVYTAAEEANRADTTLNDEWWNALQWVKENTSPESVVIADWQYGYWIEAIAERKSIMNGRHYDIQWRLLKFGKIMETDNEEIAVKEVFGFDSLSEVQKIRGFPEGDTGEELMEKEMTAFAVEDQHAYIIVDWRTAALLDVISNFGTWDYTTGKGTPVYVYAGAPMGTVLQPRWKQHIYSTLESMVAVFEAGGEYHSFFMKNESLIPTQGTLYTKAETTHFLSRNEGLYGVVWFSSDSLAMLIPANSLNSMLVRLFFFNGAGLGHFELMADYGTVKVFRIHREYIEGLNRQVVIKEDQWRPS